jgi:hypothetical protein
MPNHRVKTPANAHIKPDATEEPRASKQQPPAGVQPVEAEDSHITGTTHHQQREALQKNVSGKEQDSGHQAERHPEMPAGIHATGSFTKKD